MCPGISTFTQILILGDASRLTNATKQHGQEVAADVTLWFHARLESNGTANGSKLACHSW